MSSKEGYRHLLSDEDDAGSEEGFVRYDSPDTRSWAVRHRYSALFSILFLISTFVNALLFLKLQNIKTLETAEKSEYAGLTYDTPYTYATMDEWSGPNKTRTDELWNGLDTNGVCISLTDDYATEHDLALSGRFPWDHDRGLYFIKGIHDLHCLKLMRNLTKSLIDGEKSYVTWQHFDHCLNALRQDVICRADDTPMPAAPGKRVGDNQQLMCRDWNKLVQWTQAPAQNACYRQVGDYKSAIIGIERHAFCPEDSPYRAISEAYFQKNGHKDLWTGEDLETEVQDSSKPSSTQDDTTYYGQP